MRFAVQTQGLSEAVAALKDVRPRLWRIWAQRLFRQGQAMREHAVRTYRNAAETTPTSTASRTGRLKSAYDARVDPAQQHIDLTVGVIRPGSNASVLRYAGTHEFGATVKPRNARFLAIPLAAAKTGRGVARGTPRSFPDTFIAPGPFGGLFIMQRVGPGRKGAGNILPLFVLRRQPVTIPARPALKPTFDKFGPIIADDLLDATVDLVTHG
jgi:hypothetical protein